MYEYICKYIVKFSMRKREIAVSNTCRPSKVNKALSVILLHERLYIIIIAKKNGNNLFLKRYISREDIALSHKKTV